MTAEAMPDSSSPQGPMPDAGGGQPTAAHCNSASDAAHEQLDALDDAMFSAIEGCVTSLLRARELWPRAAAELPSDLVDESRAQYLRYAVEVVTSVEAARDSDAASSALDVIDLLSPPDAD